jgi:hypothetical protein
MQTITLRESREALSSVVAHIGYLERTTERPYDYAYAPPPGTPWQNYRSDTRPVHILDARRLAQAPSLGREGVRLCNTPTAVTDFFDEDVVRRIYYDEVADLARTLTGAKAAYVFDHLVRKREAHAPALSFGRRVSGDRPSANGRVHNDYTEASGPRRMKLVLGGRAAEVRDYAIVNVWRPIRGPVLDAPLALCDARTVGAADLVSSDVHYATRTGEIYLMTHSPRHRWFYFPEMERHEALVFKQYDSRASVPRFVPHAAFDHPHTPLDTPLRESIEARCLVVFD